MFCGVLCCFTAMRKHSIRKTKNQQQHNRKEMAKRIGEMA